MSRFRSFLVKNPRHYTIFLAVIYIVLSLPLYFNRLTNADLWKNLVVGRYLSWFHQFPHYSTFTYFPVRDYVSGDVADWLGKVILFAVQQQGGYVVLNGLKVLPLVVIVGLILLLNDWQLNLHTLLFLLIYSYGISTRIVVRALIFGLVFFPVVLYGWGRFYETSDRRYLWLIPPVMVLWSNIHGSYLIGAFVLTGLALGLFLDVLVSRKFEVSDLVAVALVGMVSLIGVTVVKPSPDTLIVDQVIGSSFVESATGTAEDVGTPPPGGVRAKMNPEKMSWFASVLKPWTFDLFRKQRPYMSPEFGYPLYFFHELDRYVAFILIPILLVAYLFFFQGGMNFSLWMGILFSFWIGASFNRAVPYAVIAPMILGLFLFRYDRTLSTVPFDRRLLSTLTAVILIVFLIYFSYAGINSFLGEGTFPDYFRIVQRHWEWGWGQLSLYRSRIPKLILEDFPRKRLYSHASIGSVVLYQFWPYKKVGQWGKTSSFETSFVRRLQRMDVSTVINAYSIELLLVRRRELLGKTLAPPAGWQLGARDSWLYFFYCCQDKSGDKKREASTGNSTG